MSKRKLAVLIIVGGLLLPVLGVAGYSATTTWLLPDPPDECDLVPIPEAQQILDGEVEILERRAEPTKLGAWSYGCTYVSRGDGFDAGELRVSLLTGVSSAGQSTGGPDDSTSLSGLGGPAWATNAVAMLRRDDMVVQISYRRLAGPPRRENVPEQTMRKVAGRLSTVPDFPESDLSGVCDRLDVRAAERLSGAELTGRRAAVRANGDVSCLFGGTDGRFEVRSTIDPEQVRFAGFSARSDGVAVRDLPVKGRKLLDPPEIGFVIDGRLFRVRLDGDESPPPQETELPKMVVDTFDACGENLATC